MSDLLSLSGRRAERQMAESRIVVLRTPYSFPYSRACNPRLDWLDLNKNLVTIVITNPAC
jgi:hypothetical protein